MNLRKESMAVVLTCAMSACGGGGGEDVLAGKQTTYEIGGVLSFVDAVPGQATPSVVLENRIGGRQLSLSTAGAFVFDSVVGGTSYEIHVPNNPSGFSCNVLNGNGQVAEASKSDIEVVCTAGAYSVRGSVSGLGANNPGLQLGNSAQFLSIDSDGPFSFSVRNGVAYSIEIAEAHDYYACELRNSVGNVVSEVTGTIDAADVQGLTVNCALPINVTVTGLALASSALQLSNTYSNPPSGDLVENLSITQDGTFRFATALPFGRSYRIDITQLPAGFDCGPGSTSGSTALVAVNVVIACTARRYEVGGTVSGLAPGTSVRLIDHAVNSTVTIDSNRAFTIGATRLAGSGFDIAVDGQPAKANCTVSNGAGVVGQGDVVSVAITCRQLIAYLYSANVSGSSISQFLVESGTGNVIASPTPHLQLSARASKVVSHPSNRFAYAAMANSIAIFNMNPDNGELSATSLSVGVSSPRDIAFNATGSNAYVAGVSSTPAPFPIQNQYLYTHQLSHYRVAALSDGSLQLQQRLQVGSQVVTFFLPDSFGVGIAPTDNFAYLGTS